MGEFTRGWQRRRMKDSHRWPEDTEILQAVPCSGQGQDRKFWSHLAGRSLRCAVLRTAPVGMTESGEVVTMLEVLDRR
jgi:hypothetical protein